MAAAEAPLVPEVRPFDFSDVETKAQELSKQSYLRDDSGMPESLVKLNYDQYRDIRYKTEKSIWRDEGLPFQVQAFHRGFMFKDRVIVNIIDHGSSTRVGYSPDLFDYGKNRFETPLPEDLGFAGL
ncbi:MAG: glucan biosynthesis protein D, partial [Gammaproteobacteria bacterium]|nr:glucan biosynthesis protein D [Gammaproteobacteria bacterium]